MKPTFLTLLGLFAAVVATVACSSAPDEPTPEDFLPAAVAPSAPPAVADVAVVYVDVSESMAGFASPGGGALFGKTLLELRSAATMLDRPLDVLVRTMAGSVSAPVRDANLLAQAGLNPGFYRGADTNLAGALSAFGTPASGGKPAALSVLVTDGVQSTSGAVGGSSCTAGSDPVCVRRKILEYLAKGWGATLLAVRSEFHGAIFSEVNRARGEAAKVTFNSRPGALDTHRPFYVYIFSPDRKLLARFAQIFRDRLLAVAPAKAVHEFPLSGPFTDRAGEVKLAVPEDVSGSLEVERHSESKIPVFYVRADLDSSPQNAKEFVVETAIPWSAEMKGAASDAERDQLTSWSLDLVAGLPKDQPGLRRAELTLASSAGPRAKLALRWPAGTGDTGWAVYRLSARPKTATSTAPLSWIRDWTTDLDTSPEFGNRTLFLEGQLLGLWNNPTVKNETLAEAYLVVGAR